MFAIDAIVEVCLLCEKNNSLKSATLFCASFLHVKKNILTFAPTLGFDLSKRIVLWCNGSTAVFGSACLGSNPGKTTQKERS